MNDFVMPRMPVVGLGASAGGIEAFRLFFENMPPDSGMAFVVVLHLPVDGKSILSGILRRWTAMTVVEATDGCLLKPNCVYVPPPGIAIILRHGRLVMHRLAGDNLRPPNPITVLFDSLAQQLGEDAVGVVLSGTGSDGALGLKAIKERGGLTLAQGSDEHGPQHSGMPSSAIATGAVDIVAPVEELPGRILAVHEARRMLPAPAQLPAEQTAPERRAICAIISRQLGHDFSGYKEATFLRRVQRRMQVLGLYTITDYRMRLESDRSEVVLLFRDLLIGVTSFFRDEETFAALKNSVIPRLFEGKTADDNVRIWVPGCATGEEAYSLAILLREHADSFPTMPPGIQIFATDIDDAAIAVARTARYPSTLLQGMSQEHLARYFTAGDHGSYTVAKQIRSLCTFSTHSLTRDPPFSRIDMISCRNLLIYLDQALQAMVIPAFHYALAPGGFLLLGSSETVSRHEDLFTTIDRPHRIFQRRNIAARPPAMSGRNIGGQPEPQGGLSSLTDAAPPARSRMNDWATVRVLERFAPAFAVVTAAGMPMQFSGRINRFLELSAGLPQQSILTMARQGLRGSLRTALRRVSESGRPVDMPAVPVPIPAEGTRQVAVTVEPRRQPGSDSLYLVVFVELPASGVAAGTPDRAADSAASPDHHLEIELRDTREQLKSVAEEYETAVEELRSANEELHSLNEELQSSNEELETSKEEIQSINEELQTVNSQLASKLEEIDHKNTDLQNLFESTQVATLFLDAYLVIRGFTPAMASIYNLIPSDRGRPITDIVSRLSYGGLRDDCLRVLSTLEPLERRVARADRSAHYLMRILPYRAQNSTVEGTIVTFVDVTSIVDAEQHQAMLIDELNHRVRNMLTVVISLASQTMRRSDSMAEFSRDYLSRVHALAAAYALLTRANWRPILLYDLLMAELAPFLADDRGNISVEGPAVLLEPRAALALGMALHELTTNAVKYGALSVTEGKVTVTWRREQASDSSVLMLEWVETGGPAISAQAQPGFGMALIERGLQQDMAAEVDVQFLPEGLRATLRAPLPAA